VSRAGQGLKACSDYFQAQLRVLSFSSEERSRGLYLVGQTAQERRDTQSSDYVFQQSEPDRRDPPEDGFFGRPDGGPSGVTVVLASCQNDAHTWRPQPRGGWEREEADAKAWFRGVLTHLSKSLELYFVNLEKLLEAVTDKVMDGDPGLP